jgi:hypothetical protein
MKPEAGGTASLPFTLCLIPFSFILFILSIPVNFFLRLPISLEIS